MVKLLWSLALVEREHLNKNDLDLYCQQFENPNIYKIQIFTINSYVKPSAQICLHNPQTASRFALIRNWTLLQIM